MTTSIQQNKALVVDLQGTVDVNINWNLSYEPSLIALIGRGVTKIENSENIKYTVNFKDLAAHMDSVKPLPIPFNNPDLESSLEDAYRNIMFVFGSNL